jgi:hypothetical protein
MSGFALAHEPLLARRQIGDEHGRTAGGALFVQDREEIEAHP